MSRLFLETAFNLGFIIGILLFIAFNFYSLSANYSGYIDGFGESGFPFPWMDSGWFLQRILWVGLIADVLVAAAFSFIVGLIFKNVWSKILSHRSPLK